MPPNRNHDDPQHDASSPNDEQQEGIEPEFTEPGFNPLDKTDLDDTNPDDDDMTLEEPPKIVGDSVPPLLHDESVAIARSPKPGSSDTLEEPPKRFLTSDPPPAPPEGVPAKPGVETRPMAPVPQTAGVTKVANDPFTKRPNSRPKNPVLVPSPDRLFKGSSEADSSWSEGDPMRPSDFPKKDRLTSEERQGLPSETPPPSPVSQPMTTPVSEPPPRRRSIPVALLATCMFVVGFVGTGAFIWWYASEHNGGEANLGTTNHTSNEASGARLPAQEPSVQPGQTGIQVPRSPVPPSDASHGTKAPIPPGEARLSAETLLQLGDDEVVRIRSAIEVRSSEDFDQALSIPRAHYDSAQEYYDQASRYDPSQRQCIMVRMAAGAERLASAYETMAESPQVHAVDAVRFPQELRDTAANYRNEARRYYQAARREQTVQPECENLATAGERRTSAALGLNATP